MLRQDSTAPERRIHSQNLLEELVSLRTEMLTLFSQLAAHRPFTEDDTIPEMLQEFCEILVDYTANAHFRLYRHIDEDTERRQSVRELAAKVYPRIVETTRHIVAFNDRYEDAYGQPPASLESDLSELGELLAERIELEDQLIDVMCSRRSNSDPSKLNS